MTASPAVNENWRVKNLTETPQTIEKTASKGAVNSSKEPDYERQISRLQQQVSSLNETVSRLGRASKVNLNEGRLAEHQTTQALLQSSFVLTSQLQRLVDHREVDPMEVATNQMQQYHVMAQENRKREVDRNLSYIDLLTKAHQETTDLCPCGKHKGIRFTNGEEVLEENLCPMNWWLKQSRLAYKNGNLADFTTNYPLSDYLFAYST